MSDAGSGYPVAQLPGLILSAYKQVFVFFFWPNGSNSFTTPLLAGLDLLALALAVGVLFGHRLPPGPVAGALASSSEPWFWPPCCPWRWALPRSSPPSPTPPLL